MSTDDSGVISDADAGVDAIKEIRRTRFFQRLT